MPDASGSTTRAVLERLFMAINQHDLDGFLACFAPTYQSAQPLHPERSFVGRERVRENWSHNLAMMADLRWEMLGLVIEGERASVEVRWSGHRPTGEPWRQQGIVVYTVHGGLIVSGRLYLTQLD